MRTLSLLECCWDAYASNIPGVVGFAHAHGAVLKRCWHGHACVIAGAVGYY